MSESMERAAVEAMTKTQRISSEARVQNYQDVPKDVLKTLENLSVETSSNPVPSMGDITRASFTLNGHKIEMRFEVLWRFSSHSEKNADTILVDGRELGSGSSVFEQLNKKFAEPLLKILREREDRPSEEATIAYEKRDEGLKRELGL